ncbi:MAG: PAS domain S-box protein, partial [Thermoplasmata archaeon]|nr:PAS domain S-box protein [Thermoplasmata archaeon]
MEIAVEALDQALTVENLNQPGLQLSRTLDLEFNCKDGSTVWSEVTISLIRDEHGVPMGLLGVARDVTERKRAEEALNNRLQFEHILSKISADLINSSYEGMDKSINEALKEVSQFTGAVRSSIFLYSDNLTKVTNTHEWCADPKDSQISLLQGIPADRFGYYFELLKKLEPVAIGNPDDMPTEAHGEREWIKEFGFRPLLFVPMIHEGALYGTVGFYGELNEERDWPQEAVGQLKILADLFVTTMERRKAEEDVRFQAMLLNQSSEYIISSDLNGCISYANEAFANALGRVPGELVGQTIDIFPEEPGELTNTEVVEKTIAEGYWKGERSMQIVDGSRLIIDLHTQILKDESGLSKGLFAIGHDITGKKKAVMALRESEEKYRNLIEGSHDLVQSVGLDGNFIFVNNAWRKTMGYPEHEIEGLKLIDIIHPESRARCQDLFQKVIAGQPQKNIEATFVSKDGRKIYVEGNAQPRRLGNKIIATQGFFRDITDRKKAEEQVRYQADLVENVSDAIISSDLEFNIVTWNRAAEALYGFKASDVIGKRVGDVTRIVYPYNSRDEVEKKFAENGYWKGEVIQRREDGEPLNILASVSMIRDSQGNPLGAVAINKDITKRKKMAEELLQSEKLASIGQLAAGMAHEVNTPLTNISLITENMMKMTNDPELMKKMKSLSEQRRHASNIVTSLLSFSRKIEPRMKMISLGNVLSDSISSLEKTKPKNIKIIKDFEKEIPKIKADHAQLRQAFTNLIDNAYDAMSEGGELTITANLKDESLVEVKFTDNGIGISMEDLEHVFDPFFTKKGVGDGVGLGLSICHGVIEAHKGTIRVES